MQFSVQWLANQIGAEPEQLARIACDESLSTDGGRCIPDDKAYALLMLWGNPRLSWADKFYMSMGLGPRGASKRLDRFVYDKLLAECAEANGGLGTNHVRPRTDGPLNVWRRPCPHREERRLGLPCPCILGPFAEGGEYSEPRGDRPRREREHGASDEARSDDRSYSVYVLRLSDGALYVGETGKSIRDRFDEHCRGTRPGHFGGASPVAIWWARCINGIRSRDESRREERRVARELEREGWPVRGGH